MHFQRMAVPTTVCFGARLAIQVSGQAAAAGSEEDIDLIESTGCRSPSRWSGPDATIVPSMVCGSAPMTPTQSPVSHPNGSASRGQTAPPFGEDFLEVAAGHAMPGVEKHSMKDTLSRELSAFERHHLTCLNHNLHRLTGHHARVCDRASLTQGPLFAFAVINLAIFKDFL